ncbi:MAG: LrgB family protein [Eubacteriales bacterium]|jgi:predicted murein hydrolase (TIGR00659 family)
MNELHELLTTSSYFGIVLCVLTYLVGMWIQKKTRLAVCNPLLISIALTIGALVVLQVDYDSFADSADPLSWLLTPTSVAFAVPLYRQLEVLRKNAVVILTGIFAGSFASCLSILVLSRLFGLSRELYYSLLPKSITTPIAIGVTEELGGYSSITVICVIFTGILGAAFLPAVARALRMTDKVAIGLGIGTSSHALGTSTALQMGEVEGAMSSLSIVVAGVTTVVLSPLFAMFY